MGNSTKGTLISFDGVGMGYRSGARVENLSFGVEPGEIVALVGLNGAGKTTLMRLALDMLRPQEGAVRLFGTPLARLPRRTWKQVGAMVEVALAYPELTVRENLRIAAKLRGADPEYVDAALAEWHLEPVAERIFRRLSLGNRQRTGLATALQHKPRLVILDEPGNGLDPASVIRLREHLTQRAAQGAAILISSHHLDEMARVADRILLMNAGRLIGELDTEQDDLERVFFERIRIDDEQRPESARGPW
ncbi:ABC transporter ATP-binding protein [Pseudarthrobacter sp. J75]|uniref:ABC transporter ATP-binding protein n=1 Tax=unclassified Pseudarthrobacter TaxID=2647000 RepID=UPI002E81E11C|nr:MULTISPECIES: ABC transporter ATP-binding protein [unclassified Pseudarthrobacter]MEE2523137.1 ABC transporter ATP-binding protein [Pseudarthrobacter sp. J47]MEE2529821.1 ABC transporter ATP-binding protein [Pseudarthrobacter sp. J75]